MDDFLEQAPSIKAADPKVVAELKASIALETKKVTKDVTKNVSKFVDARAKQTETTIQTTVQHQGLATRMQNQGLHVQTIEAIENLGINLETRLVKKIVDVMTPAKGKSSTDEDEDDPVPKKVEVVPDDHKSRDTKTTALTETSGPTKTSSSEIELNIAKDQLKEKEKENKRLTQELRSAEIELKQAQDTNRAFISRPLDKRLKAKPKEQPPTEATAASMAKHSERILLSHSTTKQKRSALSDETQTISNPGLRRSTRNLSKGK
eukprot:scaffold31182_cov72-Skeletonema_dohrnii-CCMP3373.AAC.2